MRPTFLQGERLLEQLCWVLSLPQGKLCGLSCFGTFRGATAGTVTLTVEHGAKLAHTARARGPSSVDSRLDLGASSATYQERNASRNNRRNDSVYLSLGPAKGRQHV